MSFSAIKNLILVGIALCLTCCSESPTPSSPDPGPNQSTPQAKLDLAGANQSFFNYLATTSTRASEAGTELHKQVGAFMENPNQNLLPAIRAQWMKLESELQSLHPLVIIGQNDAKSFNRFNEYLYRIQAQPIQPGYLDRFGEYAYSGLVYDIGFPLNAENLLQQHGLTDEEEAVLGIYAIEFMLFGINSNRSAKDYLAQIEMNQMHFDQGLQGVKEISENRRRKLVSLQLDQLVSDLQALSTQIDSSESLQNWYELAPQQQLSIVRRSMNSGLTQFLIQLADFQDKFLAENSSALPQPLLPGDRQRTLDKLARQLESMAIWETYFPVIEREAIATAIQSSLALLNSDNLRFGEKDNATKSLRAIYENLKILI